MDQSYSQRGTHEKESEVYVGFLKISSKTLSLSRTDTFHENGSKVSTEYHASSNVVCILNGVVQKNKQGNSTENVLAMLTLTAPKLTMHHMHSLRTETSIARIKLRMSEDGIATLSSSCLALFKNVDFLHRTILAMKYRQLHQWAELAGIIIKLNRRLEAIALRGDVSNESSQMANLYTACIASVDDRDNKIGSSTDTLSKWDTIIRLRRIACFLNDRDRVEARMAQIGVDYFPTELPIIPLSAIAKDIETFRVHCSHLIDGGALSTTTRSRRSSAKYKRSAVQANAFALELLDKVLLTQSFISSGHNGIDCLNPTFCITIHNTDFAIATLKKVSCEGDNSSESRVWRALLYMGYLKWSLRDSIQIGTKEMCRAYDVGF